jgi:hypothetical protein
LDYFQNIILFILCQEYGKGIVFKGGTALKKCYGLSRFSEDLDFTCTERVDSKKLENGLRRFNIEFEMERNEFENGLKVTLKIKGPLYIGERKSLCNFIVDFSFRENVVLQPIIKTLGRFMEETPAFDVLVMDEKEILAEKARAIMTRAKARDVYDIWFLLGSGVPFDADLIKKKLEYYGESWSQARFRKGLNMKESIWKTELEPLIGGAIPAIPSFREARKLILGAAMGAVPVAASQKKKEKKKPARS